MGKQTSLNGSKQVGHAGKKLVNTDTVLEMAPKALNQIECRAIRWQPKDPHTMFKETQSRQGSRTLMIGRIVQDQHDRTSWIVLDQKVFKKSNEVLTILAFGSTPGYGIVVPVVGGKEMM